MDHFNNPRNTRRLANPSCVGQADFERGFFLKIELFVQNDLIEEACFSTMGCVPAIACGSAATELALGKTIEQARMIEPATLYERLGGLPRDRIFCAALAVSALRKALDDYQIQRASR